MPSLSPGEIEVVAVLAMVSIVGKIIGSESRLWYSVIASALLMPSVQVVSVVCVVGIVMRVFDWVKNMR